MDQPPAINVLLVTDDPARCRRWTTLFEDLGSGESRIWFHPDEVHPDCPLDLVLTDATGPQSDQPHRRHSANDRPLDDDIAVPAVIRVGSPGPADLLLPADATERELRLACRLLAQNVRLRRELRGRAAVQRRLFRAAMTDPVTRLPNRRAWDWTIRQQTVVSRGPLCVGLLDLDHFKQVNDTWGHSAGDAVLQAVGAALLKSLRGEDFIARVGGDEFGLLLPVPDRQAAAAVVERVRGQLFAALEQSGVPAVSASAGYCMTNPSSEGGTPAQYLATADEALREAKRLGRNRTVGR